MSIDYSKRGGGGGGGGSSTPAAPPGGGAISLTKRGEKVALTKGASSGNLRINLNWDAVPPTRAPQQQSGGGGFMKKLKAAAAGGTGAIDLDLGCLFELTDGRKGVVQALGNAFGDLQQPPYIKLDKDDRSGQATDGENLFFNGAKVAEIKRMAVFAFIYEGAKNWSQANGRVTIHPPSGPEVTINLDETRDGVGMCAVCLIHGGDGFEVERQVQYLKGHRELDAEFGWGMQWSAGSK